MKSTAWRWRVAIAFTIVYLVWGSNFLAIRVGVQKLPPALFAGVRFLIAGLLLVGYARRSRQPWPRNFFEWRTIAIVGLLLLVGGNGLVVWGSQWIASNQIAIVVATGAVWIAGLGTLGRDGEPLSWQALIGLVVGLLGVGILMRPTAELSSLTLWSQVAALGSAFLWAAGTIYAKRKRPTTPPLMFAGLQSLVAGGVLCLIGVSIGEIDAWHWSWTGGAALAYLIVLGALAFAAYVWLVHEVSPAALGTYAYVNPAIAVLLGWWLLDERLAGAQLTGIATILIGVVLVTTARAPELPATVRP